jgi:ABC-type branched-subunit amino acid transport system substrate-binding protein
VTQPAAGAPRKRRGRSPGVVFSVLASVLVILVAAAFTPSQPPPPPTAEFAPAAQRPITAPPPNQTSQVGDQGKTGNRGGPHGLKTPPTPTATPSGSPPDLPNVKYCVGDPPRQTEDPQSPPCRAYWKGDNGGATSRGVTKDTVNIVIADHNGDAAAAMVNYFNKRFQFYGRQLKVVPGSCGEGSPDKLKQKAQTIAQQDVFAVMGCDDSKGAEYPFYDELARNHIVSVANRPDLVTEAHMAQFHPYEWTYFPTYDKGQNYLGTLACTLHGKTAQWGGPAYVNSTRKFGLITNTFSDQASPDLGPIMSAFKACGISAEHGTIALEHSSAQQGYSQNTEQQTASVLTKFQNDGVTTVIDLVHAVTLEQITQVASSIGYQPEHVMSSYLYNDSELGVAGLPQDQTKHLFGVSTWNPHILPQSEYWYQAVMQGNPTFKWTDPSNPGKVSATYYYNAWYVYYSLLMLAAGIQMAGPHLTPESFANGLQHTTFPNPIVPGHPEGKVSVQPGQHSYIADFSLLWFEPGVPEASYGDPSSFCYYAGGGRFSDVLPKAVATDLFDDNNGGCRRWGT